MNSGFAIMIENIKNLVHLGFIVFIIGVGYMGAQNTFSINFLRTDQFFVSNWNKKKCAEGLSDFQQNSQNSLYVW